MKTLAEELAVCDAIIRANTELLLAGHEDMDGLLQGIQDWAGERRLIEREIEGTAK